jgi:hypothetical protein
MESENIVKAIAQSENNLHQLNILTLPIFFRCKKND